MQQFFIEHTLGVVFAIVLIIWIGIAIYLMRVDKRIKKIEKKIETIEVSKE